MKRRAFCSLLGAAALPLTLPRASIAAPGADVLSIGGSVTEIVYALGQGDRLVARDSTSTYPALARDLPDVGYMRQLSPEGVLSVRPSLILSEEGAGPPETIAVLEEAAIPFVTVPEGFDAAAVAAKIRAVGAALEVDAEGFASNTEAQIKTAVAEASAHDDRPKVMFVLSAMGGRLMAAGTGTAADAMIRMSGGRNVMSGMTGYKPLSDEAAAAAGPEVILMMDRGGDHAIAPDDLFAMPALAVTPAASGKRLVTMDGLKMLGFGPRTADAVTELSAALHGA
ncbi:hemin ABC transporter substrate-binding protein [Salipiger pallidus]|uniref:Hemin ABC transporter substrate-binding protein n=1 Tax=Salipiger pallidus TaxID=1775170 RepID=A0A8J2ZHA1_9RHOB|nr:ABC transporter substrate-binding protein [Salipiger pallidus]GGG62397.1 hemin ABC transporter substrate-binding protein [Salipiger pallidus]